MQQTHLDELRVYAVDGRRFVYVPEGRGEELRLHLASHGVVSTLSRVPGIISDRLELERDTDVGTVQAIIDMWEK